MLARTLFAAVAALSLAAPAQALVIDGFDGDSLAIPFIATPGDPAERIFNDPSALAGQRDARIVAIDGIARADFVDDELALIALRRVGDPDAMQNISTWTWDLDAGVNGVQGDLGVDLTDGGAADRFILDATLERGVRLTANPLIRSLPFRFVARAYETDPLASRIGEATIDIPAVEGSSPTPFDFSLEVLFADLTANGDVDLAEAAAVQAVFNLTASSANLRIRNLCTGNTGGCIETTYTTSEVPAPPAAALLATALAALTLRRRRMRCSA